MWAVKGKFHYWLIQQAKGWVHPYDKYCNPEVKRTLALCSPVSAAAQGSRVSLYSFLSDTPSPHSVSLTQPQSRESPIFSIYQRLLSNRVSEGGVKVREKASWYFIL